MSTQRDWRAALTALVEARERPFPLSLYRAEPASEAPMPAGTPRSAALDALYGRCDGADLGGYNLFSRGELGEENVRLRRGLEAEGEVLDPTRYLLLCVDPEGAPVVWDGESDGVRTWARGGGWRTLAADLEGFLQGLFNPAPETDVMWAEALEQLDALMET